MAPALLSKTVTVLRRGKGVVFEQEQADGVVRPHRFEMDPQVWADLGLPDTVTVTIEPGDLLNAEAGS